MSWRMVRGFIDPATLITLGVLALSIVGTMVASQLVQQSQENRTQALGGCRYCSNGVCQTRTTNCSPDFNECNVNNDCPQPTKPPPTNPPAPTNPPPTPPPPANQSKAYAPSLLNVAPD